MSSQSLLVSSWVSSPLNVPSPDCHRKFQELCLVCSQNKASPRPEKRRRQSGSGWEEVEGLHRAAGPDPGSTQPQVREEDRTLSRTAGHTARLSEWGTRCCCPSGRMAACRAFGSSSVIPPRERPVNETITWFANGTRGSHFVRMFMFSESRFVAVTTCPWPVPLALESSFPRRAVFPLTAGPKIQLGVEAPSERHSDTVAGPLLGTGRA